MAPGLHGVVSPADPGLSVEVLVAQMEEAHTKVVFCCLATLDKMEKVRDRLGRYTSWTVMKRGVWITSAGKTTWSIDHLFHNKRA